MTFAPPPPSRSRALAPPDAVSTSSSRTTIELRPTFSEFDRHFQVPAATLLRWAMEARWNSDLVSRLASYDVTRRIMVKAQVVRRLNDAASPRPGSRVRVEQVPHAISNSSFTLSYTFSLAEDSSAPAPTPAPAPWITFAQALVVMVFVDVQGPKPQASPLPAFLRSELEWTHSDVAEARAHTTDLTIASQALSRVPAPVPGDAASPPTSAVAPRVPPHTVVVRSSDEDVNHHVSHAKYADFFTDALAARGIEEPPETFYLEYLRETHREDVLDVHTVVQPDSRSVVLFLMSRDNPALGPASRAICSWPVTSQALVEQHTAPVPR